MNLPVIGEVSKDNILLFGGLAIAAYFLFSPGNSSPSSFLTKIKDFLGEKLSGILGGFPASKDRFNDAMEVHDALGKIIGWFQSKNDSKGVASTIVLGQYVYEAENNPPPNPILPV